MPTPRGDTKNIILLAVLSFGISLLVFLSDVLGTLELKAYDLYSQLLNPSRTSEDIVVVQVDQRSIDALAWGGVNWPWPRQIYAQVIEYLSEAEAVFIDIPFTEPSPYGAEDDRMLAEACKKSLNVFLPVVLLKQQRALSAADEEFLRNIAFQEKVATGAAFSAAITPIDVLKDAVVGAGNITITADRDGVYRRIPLAARIKQQTVPHFALGSFLRKGTLAVRQNALYARNTRIPLTEGKFMLRYPGKGSAFTTLSAIDILKSAISGTASGESVVTRDFFKGKTVLIGVTAAGLYDAKPTPVVPAASDVFIHAALLDNIAGGNFMRQADSVFVVAFMLLIVAAVCLLALQRYSCGVTLAFFPACLLIVLGVTVLSFMNAWYLNIVAPVAALLLSFSITAAYRSAAEGRERLFMRKTLSPYMDKQLVEYVLQHPSLLNPGGRRKRITVLFTDVTGFASYTENVSAERAAMVLHTLLNAFTEVIIRNSGVIGKYISDSIMAFWGAPLRAESDESNACRAALECMDALKEVNVKLKQQGLPEIAVRIGVHTGDAIVGNIGRDGLFEYTAIGDAVNLASRLESINKVFKTGIIVSEETLQRTGDDFFVRELGMIEVKGKTLPVKLFELVGESGAVRFEKRELVREYLYGLTLYKEQKWYAAIQTFQKLLDATPQDGPSEFYKRRCEYLIEHPKLAGDWDIVNIVEKERKNFFTGPA
ncbi:MAG: CHASE2 domain-containing protein [Nitrospirota bacterium]